MQLWPYSYIINQIVIKGLYIINRDYIVKPSIIEELYCIMEQIKRTKYVHSRKK